MNTMKYLYGVILFMISISVFSQEYVSNVRLNISGDKLYIHYDLNKHKNGAKYNVSAFLSEDNGITYQQIANCEGAVGKRVSVGNNKRIVWDLEKNGIGGIGTLKVKVEAVPVFNSTTIGFSYLKGIYPAYDGVSYSKGNLLLGFRKKNKNTGYFAILLGLREGHKLSDEYYSEKYDPMFNMCLGYITKRKSFSVYGGISTGKYSYGDDNYDNITGVVLGMQFKLVGSLHIPIELQAVNGESSVNIGLGLQF